MSIRILPHCLVGAGFACLKTSTWMYRGGLTPPLHGMFVDIHLIFTYSNLCNLWWKNT